MSFILLCDSSFKQNVCNETFQGMSVENSGIGIYTGRVLYDYKAPQIISIILENLGQTTDTL